MNRILVFLFSFLSSLITIMAAEVVSLPTGVEAQPYYYLGFSYESDTNPTHLIYVALDGEDIYIKGMCEQLPEAWIKGNMINDLAVFPSGQYMGQCNGDSIYMCCSMDRQTTKPLEIEYNPSNDTFEAYYQYLIFCRNNEIGDLVDLLQNMTFFSGRHNTVEPAPHMETKLYTLTADNSDNGSTLNYDVRVGMDGDYVYIQGICKAFPEAWIYGTLENNIVTFERNQYLGYMDRYKKDIWFTGINKDEAYFTAVQMYYDEESQEFLQPESLWMVFNGDPIAYHYYQTLLNVKLTPTKTQGDEDIRTLVLPPSDIVLTSYDLKGLDYTFSAPSPLEINGLMVGRVADTLYVQGLFADIPEAWVKGVFVDQNTVQFAGRQYLGKWYDEFDTWLMATELSGTAPKDFVMTFDSTRNIYTLQSDVQIGFSDDPEKLTEMAFALYRDLQLVGDPAAVGIHHVGLSASQTVYDLQGRVQNTPQRGLCIKNRKIFVNN